MRAGHARHFVRAVRRIAGGIVRVDPDEADAAGDAFVREFSERPREVDDERAVIAEKRDDKAAHASHIRELENFSIRIWNGKIWRGGSRPCSSA